MKKYLNKVKVVEPCDSDIPILTAASHTRINQVKIRISDVIESEISHQEVAGCVMTIKK